MSRGADEILYWEGRSGRQVRSPQREYTQWASWSCKLGWPVMGIWQEGFDGTDINAVHASEDGSLLVVADDRGGVCLYRFPCVAAGAPCFRAAGHSSHVMNVRWLLGATGLEWRDVGTANPQGGTPLPDSRLAEALREKTHFTEEEWGAFGITDLRADHVVEAGGSCFKPLAERCVSVGGHDRAVLQWRVERWPEPATGGMHGV